MKRLALPANGGSDSRDQFSSTNVAPDYRDLSTPANLS